MKSGKGPERGSSNVGREPGLGRSSDRSRISGGGHRMSGVPVDRYACAGRGFVETCLAKEEGRRTVAEKWPLAVRSPDP